MAFRYITWIGWDIKTPEHQAVIDQIQITNQNLLKNFDLAYLWADKQLMTKVARFIDLQPGKILYPRRMMWPLFHEAAEKLVECLLEISPPPTTNLPPRDPLTNVCPLTMSKVAKLKQCEFFRVNSIAIYMI